MSSIKAILFDMDGVLIDAKDWHYEALNKALELFGYSISRYDHLSTYDGLPTYRKLEMLTLERGLPQGLHLVINKLKQKYTQDIISQKCRPWFQHEYALSKLKQDGYKIAVCSNSIRESIELMLTRACLIKYVDLILSNQDVTQAKPAPEIYLKAMEFFKIKPAEALIIEDNENGIKAAVASGGHLLTVKTVQDVHLQKIKAKLQTLAVSL